MTSSPFKKVITLARASRTGGTHRTMAGPNVLMSKDVTIAAGAIGFNYSVTMGIIFVNKLLFLRTKFPVLTLAASHLAVSALFTRAAMYAGVFKPRDAKVDRMIFAVAALQTLAISLGQASLKLNSMGFFQLTKQMQVPLVASIEFFYLGRRLNAKKVGLLVLMTLGVCTACASDVQFSWLGALMAATGTACTSVEAVLYSYLQQSLGWETLQLLYKTMPMATAGMAVVAMYNDFGVNAPSAGAGDIYGAGSGNFLTGMDAVGTTLFLSSCALGMAVNVSSCFVNGKASALAYAMLGLAKTITVILVGIAFFDGVPTTRVAAGTLTAICAILMYTKLTLDDKARAAALKNSGMDEKNDTVEMVKAPLMESSASKR